MHPARRGSRSASSNAPASRSRSTSRSCACAAPVQRSGTRGRGVDLVGLRSSEHGRRHARVGRRRDCPSSATTRLRETSSERPDDEPAAARLASTTPRADVELGHALVREYVVATAEEQAGPGADRRRSRRYSRTSPTGTISRVGSSTAAVRSSCATVDGAAGGLRRHDAARRRRVRDEPLWVREPFRACGLGRRLATRIDGRRRAARLHAHAARRDARAAPGAIALYQSMGFVDVPPRTSTRSRCVFLGRDL